MPALIVFTQEQTLDPGEHETYRANVRMTLVGHQVTARAAYGTLEVLEGSPIEGAVVLEFPTMEAARDWYRSPAYQEVAKHRFRGARYRAFIVQGV
jgi:uncharacterized protein (DUF1330 family)